MDVIEALTGLLKILFAILSIHKFNKGKYYDAIYAMVWLIVLYLLEVC